LSIILTTPYPEKWNTETFKRLYVAQCTSFSKPLFAKFSLDERFKIVKKLRFLQTWYVLLWKYTYDYLKTNSTISGQNKQIGLAFQKTVLKFMMMILLSIPSPASVCAGNSTVAHSATNTDNAVRRPMSLDTITPAQSLYLFSASFIYISNSYMPELFNMHSPLRCNQTRNIKVKHYTRYVRTIFLSSQQCKLLIISVESDLKKVFHHYLNCEKSRYM
jgi:hypothetical protein